MGKDENKLIFSVNNFKSLNNEDLIEFNPITVFCGINSCGKSSILQSQLLISQSLTAPVRNYRIINEGRFYYGRRRKISGEKSQRGKILNFEGKYCHLQDFINIIFENEKKFPLSFKWFHKGIEIIIELKYKEEDLEFSSGYPIINTIEIKIKEQSIKIDKISDQKYKLTINGLFKKVKKQHFFGFDYFLRKGLDIENLKGFTFSRKEFINIEKEFENIISKNLNQKLEFNNIHLFIDNILTFYVDITRQEFLNSLKKYKIDAKIEDFLNKIDFFDKNEKNFEKNMKKLKSDFIDTIKSLIIDTVDRFIFRSLNVLKRFYLNIRYLGPLREEPRRFYQISNLNPLGIGIKGENTPQILILEQNKKFDFKKIEIKEGIVNFSKIKKKTLLDALNDWLEIMNLSKIQPKSPMKLISQIGVNYSENQPENSSVSIIDVGFGVSQILPVLVETLRMGEEETLILEQPEIHLHPKLQGDLADFILSNAKIGKKFLIETHSEYFVKRLCLRIAQDYKERLKDLIKIYFVVPNKISGSKIINIEIDEYGLIKNWPKGFFDESDEAAILNASVKKRKTKDSM